MSRSQVGASGAANDASNARIDRWLTRSEHLQPLSDCAGCSAVADRGALSDLAARPSPPASACLTTDVMVVRGAPHSHSKGVSMRLVRVNSIGPCGPVQLAWSWSRSVSSPLWYGLPQSGGGFMLPSFSGWVRHQTPSIWAHSTPQCT